MQKFTLLFLCLLILFFSELFPQKHIEVTTLNSFSYISANTTVPILWNHRGINNVKVEYCTQFNNTFDSPNNWQTIVASVPAMWGGYQWIVPDLGSFTQAVRVKVTDIDDATVYDLNNNDLIITNTPGKLKITTPNGGEHWGTGDSLHNITWQYEGFFDVQLEYSTDGGTSWNIISTGNLGYTLYSSEKNYVWKIPNIQSNQCKIKISSKYNPNIFDVSDNNFEINNIPQKHIEVTTLNSFSYISANTTVPILWNHRGINNVKVEYCTQFNNTFDSPNNWQTIVASVPAMWGGYQWIVPDLGSFTQAVRVKVTDIDDATVYDLNNNDLIITNTPGKLKITTPNGGEHWGTGDSLHNITWQYEGFFDVQLEYSTDGGTSWNLISTDNLGYTLYSSEKNYVWKIPNTPSVSCMIKIKSKYNSTISDSSKLFSIHHYSTFVEEELSNLNYILRQNYPNPLNAVTFIQYDLPQSTHVRLKIYDILGNEVETLVNQEQETGRHEVLFNADRLASGVYLYKLETVSFNDVKKMILMK